MLLWLFMLATDSGAGIELPPESDPVARYVGIALLFLAGLSPLLLAKIQRGKTSSNVVGTPPLAVAPPSSTPRMDVGQQYLEQYVASLVERAKAIEDKYEERLARSEAKNEDLSRQVQTLMEDRAVFKTQVESLRADNVELRADNVELRAEVRALRSRLNG